MDYMSYNPMTKRMQVFNGTTDANGEFSGTYSPAFTQIPHIAAEIVNQSTPNYLLRVSSSTVNGFTVKAETKSALTILALDVVSFNATNQSGLSVSVAVIEQ